MRITTLQISNFRNIRNLSIEGVPDIVLFVGPNGCGKTSVLDAIVLAKEAVGTYYSLQSDPRQVNVGAEYAEIHLEIDTSQIEREMVKRESNQILEERTSCRVRLTRAGTLQVMEASQGLHNLFSTYRRRADPEAGVIEYLPSFRTLRKKQLDTYSSSYLDEQRFRKTALYRESNRFEDIKEYLAAQAFQAAQHVEHRILTNRETIGPSTYTDPFADIKRVFAQFFAPMSFVTVRIGTTPFQYVISTPSGEIDLDDLSDGEKSVFTVAFDIIRRDVRNSIILFDEPELHLHGELARQFVNGLSTIRPGNQFWITTHSPEIVTSADVGSVYRITKYEEKGINQARQVFSSVDMRDALESVLGRVGIVTLNKTIVFLEGSGEEIDRFILESLYRDKLDRLEFVSAGSAKDVNQVSSKILALLGEAEQFNFFSAIRDRDFMTEDDAKSLEERGKGRLFVWPFYHIENVLLESMDTLLESVRALKGPSCPFNSIRELEKTCHSIAESCIPSILGRHLDLYLSAASRPTRNVDPARAVDHAAEIALELSRSRLSKEAVQKYAATFERRLKESLASRRWKRDFPGREILRKLAGRLDIKYKQLRNVVIEKSSPPRATTEIIESILKLSSHRK